MSSDLLSRPETVELEEGKGRSSPIYTSGRCSRSQQQGPLGVRVKIRSIGWKIRSAPTFIQAGNGPSFTLAEEWRLFSSEDVIKIESFWFERYQEKLKVILYSPEIREIALIFQGLRNSHLLPTPLPDGSQDHTLPVGDSWRFPWYSDLKLNLKDTGTRGAPKQEA